MPVENQVYSKTPVMNKNVTRKQNIENLCFEHRCAHEMNIVEITDIILPIACSIQDSTHIIKNLCTDSRQVSNPAHTLFFAIKTEKNDGHRYIPELIKNGVLDFIITDPNFNCKSFPACNFLTVKNAIHALQQIVIRHRQQFDCPIIGITGSNGKTIVKEWLYSMLIDDYVITKSPDSYNSQIGVPLSVWGMNTQTQLAIFEAGISKPDEMDNLARIIQPSIGILTNLGMAHAQFFDDNRQKLIEKLKLFQNAHTLIYHNNNELINNILQKDSYKHLQKISWGSATATYPVTDVNVQNNHTLFTIQDFRYAIPFVDAASVENATHVIITMLTLGYPPDIIQARLARLTAIQMRLAIREGLHHSILIDDTYSLDINSLKIALEFLETQSQLPNKTLIISDFEQVGLLQDNDYVELNTLLQQYHIAKLIAVGDRLCRHRRQFQCPNSHFFRDTDELLQNLSSIPFAYEAILIKGARKFHFETVVSRLQDKTHLTILQVSLPALVYNLNFYRRRLKPTTKMAAIVKAMSYGLGDAEPINELVQQHIDYLAVAYTDEGVRLRKRHIETPIIVLGAEAHSFDVMVQSNLEPEIFNFYYLHELEEVLKRHPSIRAFPIHLKMDTGMHRLGFDVSDLPELIHIIRQNPQLKIASVFSHLAAAEDPKEDTFTRKQIALFKRMKETICRAFPYPILCHILNSAGIIRFPEAQFDMVRLGIGLYGFSEIPEIQACLQNVATLKTIVTQVKHIPAGETIGYNRSYPVIHDMQVAIIPIGYADGYSRELGNGRGTVILQGQKVPVIGKVCMDMCMLDVTGLTVHEGDEVIVYGEGNTAAEMAAPAGRISYEMLTAISRRVPRVYVKE